MDLIKFKNIFPSKDTIKKMIKKNHKFEKKNPEHIKNTDNLANAFEKRQNEQIPRKYN